MNKKEIIAAIMQMERDDLNEIVGAVNVRRDTTARLGTLDFRPGMKVEFTSRQGNVVKCEVIKPNQKTVTCRHLYSSQEWRVPPTMLTVSED